MGIICICINIKDGGNYVFDFPFLKVFLLITKSIPYVFLNPLFWFVVFLVWLQYKRTVEMEEKLFGRYINSLREQTVTALLYGLIGGIVGSFLLIFVGVSITNVGIHIAWLLALFLMLIHPRFICFSYAGGILSLVSLIFGYPKIDVPGLMAIVAILHFVEGVLVYTNGYKQPTPIFMKEEEYGIVGGFSLQKFWPLPLMILLTVVAEELPKEVINMPEWWPLVRPSPDIVGKNFFYMMFPIVAGLGYGDISLTRFPEKKAKISALNLGIFSTILLILSILASRINIFKYAASIFAPLAHEFLIFYGRGIEKKNKPIFIPPEKGELVLDVFPNSPAKKMGLKKGDIITALNGISINNKEDIYKVLNNYPTFLWLDGKTTEGTIFSYEYSDYKKGVDSLGIILVPRDGDVQVSVNEVYEGLLLKYIKQVYNKIRKNKN